MLITLLRRFLPRYAPQTWFVLFLLLIQSLANLYLPNLNADIINNGVAKADTDYIWRTGAVMLGVTLLLGILSVIAVYYRSEERRVGKECRSRWSADHEK